MYPAPYRILWCGSTLEQERSAAPVFADATTLQISETLLWRTEAKSYWQRPLSRLHSTLTLKRRLPSTTPASPAPDVLLAMTSGFGAPLEPVSGGRYSTRCTSRRLAPSESPADIWSRSAQLLLSRSYAPHKIPYMSAVVDRAGPSL